MQYSRQAFYEVRFGRGETDNLKGLHVQVNGIQLGHNKQGTYLMLMTIYCSTPK